MKKKSKCSLGAILWSALLHLKICSWHGIFSIQVIHSHLLLFKFRATRLFALHNSDSLNALFRKMQVFHNVLYSPSNTHTHKKAVKIVIQ